MVLLIAQAWILNSRCSQRAIRVYTGSNEAVQHVRNALISAGRLQTHGPVVSDESRATNGFGSGGEAPMLFPKAPLPSSLAFIITLIRCIETALSSPFLRHHLTLLLKLHSKLRAANKVKSNLVKERIDKAREIGSTHIHQRIVPDTTIEEIHWLSVTVSVNVRVALCDTNLLGQIISKGIDVFSIWLNYE